MADPLSIAASTASLVALCGKITHFLFFYVADVGNVNDVLQGLSKEVESLSTALNSISVCWKSTKAFTSSVPTELVGILASLRATLDDCQATLEGLEGKLANPGSNRVMRQLKMSLRMGDIQLLRQRVQSHTGAANLAMQAIHLYITSKNINEQAVRGSRIDNLLGQLSTQIRTLRNTQEKRHSGAQTKETDRIIGNLDRLVEVTEAYANTIHGDDDRSTLVANSTSTISRDRIYSWLSETEESSIPTDKPPDVSSAYHDSQDGPLQRDQNSSTRPMVLAARDFPDDKTHRNSRILVSDSRKHDVQATKCLDLMTGSNGLRENICRLEWPGQLKSELNSQTINRRLPADLQYACRYWVYHFERGRYLIENKDRVHSFLQKHFLHWLEALSFMEKMFESLLLVDALISRVAATDSEQALEFLKDARRFVLYHRNIINEAPLQLYCSALASAPSSSIIRRTFKNDIPAWMSPPSMVPRTWGLIEQAVDGHSREVTSVAFSPDGTRMASGSADRAVRVWDMATGKAKHVLTGHINEVRSVAFSPNGQTLASGSADRTVRIWDVTTGQPEKRLLGHCDWVKRVAFSPDGHKLASVSWDRKVLVWDVATGHIKWTLEGHTNNVNSVAFSADGSKLASASFDRTVRIWDAVRGQAKQTLQTESALTVAFSPDGCRLASGSLDATIELWNVVTGRVERRLTGHSSYVQSVAFSPDGSKLVSGSSDSTIRVWNVATGETEQTLDGHSDTVCCVAFSPDGDKLLSGSYDRGMLVWNLSTAPNQPEHMPSSHSKEITCLAFSLDGSKLASGSKDNTVRVWDVSTGRTKWLLKGHSSHTYDVAFSPDGRRVVSVSADSTTRVWNVATGQEELKLENPLGPRLLQSALSVAFSRDGKRFATGYFDTVTIWNATTGQAEQTLEGQRGAIRGLAFSPDGTKLASGSVDSSLMVRDITTGRIIWQARESSTGLAFSPDGTMLATRSGYSIQVYDLSKSSSGSAAPAQALRDHYSPASSSAFLPDGTYSPSIAVVDKRWVYWNGSKALHLPVEIRPGVVASSQRAVAIGSPGGRVTIIGLNREMATWLSKNRIGRG